MEIFDLNSRNAVRPASGTLLIAEPYLRDPGFSKAVVFICEHSKYGTLGFVLNRPSKNTVNMLLPELHLPGIRIYEGGPVETNTLQIVHRLPNLLGGIEIIPGIFWGGSYDALSALCNTEQKVDPTKIRLFRGYSGWDVGKLDSELSQGSWLIAQAKPSIIFNGDTEKTWEASLKILGEDFAYLARLPQDPSLN